jgi:mRNA interferase MazF
MKRGDLYRVAHPSSRDPKRSRVFAVVSRQTVIDSRFSTVICAPVYSSHDGLSTQVLVGIDEGLKHDSSLHGDELVSLPKTSLTNFVGTLSLSKIQELDRALRIALDLVE